MTSHSPTKNELVEGDDSTVTAIDVLQAQVALEREAAEVLPGRFDRCTRSLGPTRQSAYACLTCSPTQPHGICYACSIACHADHRLVELFERRRFLCDCATDLPTSNSNSNSCQIQSNDTSIYDIENEDKGSGNTAVTTSSSYTTTKNIKRNQYDHNYLGRFCRCDEEYDPDKEPGTMYQCAICEDWFHDRCINNMPQCTDLFEEFCCQSCVVRLPFLKHYAIDTNNTVIDKDTQVVEKEEKENSEEKKRSYPDNDTTIEEITTKRVKIELNNHHNHHNNVELESKVTECWRNQLCHCQQCMDIYNKEDVTYLLSVEETYQPEKDEDSDTSLFELGMQQLAHMDRTRAIDGLLAYNQLCGEIKSFLGQFATTGKVVTKSDVESFFADKMRKN
ncbi:hypothetical protein BDF19DRAFT_432516 [Syncephalis fuscata]|nr:hypothetical protein BDF19DRAFT_432516 [Syncephalis fuscata]